MSEDILTRTAPAGAIRLTYGMHESQYGDLWLPLGPGPFPVAVIVHGGYWRAQYGLTYMGHLCHALSGAGVACWSLEYRRLGQAGGGWPATMLDVSLGMEALRTLAVRFPLDLERVLISGHSAGGHLALWLAARPRLRESSPLSVARPLRPRAVVAIAPVADLALALQLGLSRGVVGELLGGGPDQVPERYADASPIELLPLGVRQVLIHGSDDDVVPLQICRRYAQAAHGAGDSIDLLVLEGADHFDPVDPLSAAWPTVYQALTSHP